MTRYDLDIDDRLCWGCKTCEVACKQEHRAPYGVKLIAISEEGPCWTEGTLTFSFRVNRCRHCDEPACLEACAFDAITRRRDGIVVLDDAACTGCRACLEACPHEAIAFDERHGVARKCNLCHHRLDQGLLPACADNVCLAHCIRLTR